MSAANPVSWRRALKACVPFFAMLWHRRSYEPPLTTGCPAARHFLTPCSELCIERKQVLH